MSNASLPARGAWRRPGLLVATAVTFAAPLIVLLVVAALAVDVPRWDEWEYTHFLVRAVQGSATAADLFAQHNESRVAVGRLVLLAFAVLTNWNLRAQSFVAPALAGITLLLLAQAGRASLGTCTPTWTTAVAFTSVLVFSTTQNDNWMMPLQFIAFIPGACLAGIVYLGVTTWRWWIRWVVGVLLCLVATFSVPNGLVLWVLAWPALWWPLDRAQERMRAAGLALWAVAGSFTLWFFFHGFVRVAQHGRTVTPLSDPALFPSYFLTFLGAPFARGTAFPAVSVAALPGAILLGALAYAALRALRTPDERRAAGPWLLLGGFALCQALAGAALRSSFGLIQALPSRYATYSLMLPIALTWLTALAWARRDRAGRVVSARVRTMSTAAVASLVTLLALSSAQAVREMRGLSERLMVARAGLGFLGHVGDTRPFDVLYPRPDLLPGLASPLWKLGWLRPARRPNADVPGPTDEAEPGRAGWLETGTLSAGTIILEGWAIVPTSGRPADLVAIASHDNGDVGHVVAFATKHAEPKPYLGLPGDPRRLSGWTAVVDSRDIPQDARRLTAWALDGRTGRAFRLHGEHVVPPATALAATPVP